MCCRVWQLLNSTSDYEENINLVQEENQVECRNMSGWRSWMEEKSVAKEPASLSGRRINDRHSPNVLPLITHRLL